MTRTATVRKADLERFAIDHPTLMAWISGPITAALFLAAVCTPWAVWEILSAC